MDKPLAILAIRGTQSPADCLTDLRFEVQTVATVPLPYRYRTVPYCTVPLPYCSFCSVLTTYYLSFHVVALSRSSPLRCVVCCTLVSLSCHGLRPCVSYLSFVLVLVTACAILHTKAFVCPHRRVCVCVCVCVKENAKPSKDRKEEVCHTQMT